MQESPVIDKSNVNRFMCDNCGANMVFDPKVGKLACPYCNYAKEIVSDKTEISERDFHEFLRPENQRLQPMAIDAMQVSCATCGATVVFIPPETAKQCDFCGGKLVAQPKAADPLVAPESVLPFALTDGQAHANLKSWTTTRWFAPSKLKTLAEHARTSSIYLPFWTFDSDSTTDYTGERGDNYTESESYTENGERKTRTVVKTRWSYAAGNVSRHFDDTPVPASKTVLPAYLESLQWNFSELVPYEPAYLAGHKAQTYQVSLEEGFERFKQIAEQVIAGDVRADIGGDSQQIHSMNAEFSNITFKHTLVPVYAGAYRFNNKVFQVVINGRTGEVHGERPYSWIKIAALVVFILIVVMIVAGIGSASR
jgi:DNA-directed RNA polymerase subunit RPC12/RpoP